MSIIDQPDTPEIKEVLFPPNKGMINNRYPVHLQMDEAVNLYNVNLSVLGRRSKVAGLLPFGGPVTGASNPMTLLCGVDITTWDASSNPYSILGKWGNNIWEYNYTSETWTDRTGSESLCSTYYQAAIVSDYLWLTACVNPTDADPHSYSSLTRLDVTNNWAATTFYTSTFNVRSITGYLNRLWQVQGNYVRWSYQGGGTPGGASFQFKDSDRNVTLTAVREGLPSLLIWREHSIWLLEDISWSTDGYKLDGATNALDYTKTRIRPLVEEIGLVSPRGVVWVPGAPGGGDFFFLSNDGIRSLNRSLSDVQAGATLPLSDRIQETIDRINWPYADRSCAGQWEGIAYFSVPVDGAINPNLTIVYDSHRDAWSLRTWTADAYATISYPGKARHLYFANNTAVTESSLSNLYGYQIYQTNCSSSDYGGGLTALGGDPVTYTEITRQLTFDIDPPPNEVRSKKRWFFTELQISPGATAATLSLDYRIDGIQEWTNLCYIDIPASTTNLLIKRKYSLQHLTPGYYLQYRLQDTTSYADWKIVHWTTQAIPMNPTFE